MKNSQKPYFLFSFLPALAYWYLETYYNLEIALFGGALLAIIEIIIEKKITGHIHSLSKFNLVLIVILGGLSLVAREGIFFKLQPTFTGLLLSSFLIFKKIKNESLLLEMLREMNQKIILVEDLYKKMEWHLCLFLINFSLFMVWITFCQSTTVWLFWKTAGFYIASFGFMLFELAYLNFIMRRSRK
jgi:intracellular septation protein